jgi:hypothetical protein
MCISDDGMDDEQIWGSRRSTITIILSYLHMVYRCQNKTLDDPCGVYFSERI